MKKILFLSIISFAFLSSFCQSKLELNFDLAKADHVVGNSGTIKISAKTNGGKVTTMYAVDSVTKRAVTINGADQVIATINQGKKVKSVPGGPIVISGTKVCTTYVCTNTCTSAGGGVKWCCEMTLKVIPCTSQ